MQIISNAHIKLKSLIHIAITHDHVAGKITNLFFGILAGYNVVTHVYRKFIATPLLSANLSSTEKIEIEKLIHTRTPDSLQKAFVKLKDKYEYNVWEKLLLNVVVVNQQSFLSYFQACPEAYKLQISKKLGALAQVFNDEEFSKSVLKQIVALEIKEIETQNEIKSSCSSSSQLKDVSKVSQLISKYDHYRTHQKRKSLFKSLCLKVSTDVEDDFARLKEIEFFIHLELKTLEQVQKELSSIKETVKGTDAYSKLEEKVREIEEIKKNLKSSLQVILKLEKPQKNDLLNLIKDFKKSYQFFENSFAPNPFYEKAVDIAHKLPETNEKEVKEKLESYLKIEQVLSKNDEIDRKLEDQICELCERIKEKDYALDMVGYFVELSKLVKADVYEETQSSSEENKSTECLLHLASDVAINAKIISNNKQLENVVQLMEALHKNGKMNSLLDSISLKIEENYQYIQPKNKEELKEKIRLLCLYLKVCSYFDLYRNERITTFYNHVVSDKFFKDLSAVEQIELDLQTFEFLKKCDHLILVFDQSIFNSIKILPANTFVESQAKMQLMKKIFLLDIRYSLHIFTIEQFHEDMLALAASVPTIKDQLDIYGDLVSFYIKNKDRENLKDKFAHRNFNFERIAEKAFVCASEITSSSTFKDLSPREKVQHLEKLAELREMISIELSFGSKVITPSALIEEAFKEAKNIEDPKVEKPLPQSFLSRLSFGPSYVEAKCNVYLRLAKKMNILNMDIKDVVTAISEIQYKAERVDSEVFHLCRAIEELDKILEDENKETLQKPLLEKVEVRLKEAVEKAITLTEIERVVDGYKTFTNTLIELAPELSVYDSYVQNPYDSYGSFPFGPIFRALNNLPHENIAKITELKAKAISLSPEIDQRRKRFQTLLKKVINHPTRTIKDVKDKYKALSTLCTLCFDTNSWDVFLKSSLFSDIYFEMISSKSEAEKMKDLLLTISKTFKEKCSDERYLFFPDELSEVSNLFKRFEKLALTPLERTETYLAFAENIEIWATVDQLGEILKKIQDNLMLIPAGQEFKNLMEKVNHIEIQLDLLKQKERISDSTSSSSEEFVKILSTNDEPSPSQKNGSFVVTNSPLLMEKLKRSDEVIASHKIKCAAIRFIASWGLARIMAKTTINLGCRFFTIINRTSVSGYKRLVGLYRR